MKIQSDFALLDVKKGRKALFKLLGPSPSGPKPNEDKKVRVTITGYIVGAWGDDDGTSREFQVDVDSVEVG